jgi:thiosulfate reductase cytochrome b subunit
VRSPAPPPGGRGVPSGAVRSPPAPAGPHLPLGVSPPIQPPAGGLAPRRAQPWPIRAAHWANAILLAILAGSGLQILAAYPFLGARGALYRWYPLQGVGPPPFLTIGGWLAGARHWHFAFAWLFAVNALAYAAYLLASGEWRRRLFWPPRDARNAWETTLHDLRIRGAPPTPAGLYNGMQRLAYTAALGLAGLLVLSGLALYEPVQLPRLTALLGGYDAARAVHLLALAALSVFLVVHVVQAARHPGAIVDMVTGGGARPPEAHP